MIPKVIINRITILQFTCLVVITIYVLYFTEINNYLNKLIYNDYEPTPNTNPIAINNSYEGFITTSKMLGPTIDYEYDGVLDSEYPTTIYEESAEAVFNVFPIMTCNLLPTKKSSVCRINNVPIVKYKFPVHITKLPDGVHLAVFNDGRIYRKRNLTDKMWAGPLRNSKPNRNVPLRVITLNPEGNRLMGVGYDNKGYIKLLDPNSTVSTETEWQYIPGLEDIIYIGFTFDATTNQNKYIIINTEGKLQLSNSNNPVDGFFDASIIKDKILKFYFDVDEYMMVIDSNFRLRIFEDKDWMVSELSTKFPPNPNPVNDVIYDYDQLLFGCVFLPKMGMCEVMKQEEPAFMSPFIPFELNRFLDSKLNRRLTDRLILKTKMGIFTRMGLMEEDMLDDDINMAYQRQQLKDKKRLREFCSSRGIQTDVNYRNYEMDKVIDENERKINKLEQSIKELISFDPDIKKIQDSTLGVNFLKNDEVKDLLTSNTSSPPSNE